MKKAQRLISIINEIAKTIPHKPKEVQIRRAPKDVGRSTNVYKKFLPTTYDTKSVASELAGYDAPGREDRTPAEEYKRYELERKAIVIRELEKAQGSAKRAGFFFPDLGTVTDEDLEMIVTGTPGNLRHEKELIELAKEELRSRKVPGIPPGV